LCLNLYPLARALPLLLLAAIPMCDVRACVCVVNVPVRIQRGEGGAFPESPIPIALPLLPMAPMAMETHRHLCGAGFIILLPPFALSSVHHLNLPLLLLRKHLWGYSPAWKRRLASALPKEEVARRQGGCRTREHQGT